MEKHLHIICLDVPYPVDYGGVFDLFYKLPALQQQGVKIHLHCFEYGRGQQPELNKYCESVHYYPRRKGMEGFSFSLPYIVSSRINDELLNRLLEDNHPILMEGTHCTYLLTDKRFEGRKCYVRLHNAEHIYYRHLAANEHSFAKKLYFLWESFQLKKYEKAIARKAAFWSVATQDAEIFKKLGGQNVQAEFLPLFLPPWQVSCEEGIGTYCLYQGNLSVSENVQAAKWLIKNVFNDINIPFVIAGKNPPDDLKDTAEKYPNICVVADPNETEMQDMISKAQIHIIPSFNATGIKLKLINALYNGRHCVVNEAAVEGSGLETACHIAANADAFKSIIYQLYRRPFGEEEIELRKHLLEKMFDNEGNAEKVVEWIWG